MMMVKRILLAITMFATLVGIAQAQDSGATFIQSLRNEALARGVSAEIFDRAMAGYQPIERVTRQSSNQAEFVQTVEAYIQQRVDTRISPGRRHFSELTQTLRSIEARYGVSGEVLIAIWGMETNFGSTLGGENVIHALATLAQSSNRASYFREELLTAFSILQDGHISAEAMVGSWAGAMGQTQFMPSSFTRFAVDFTGDGRKDIWSSIPDALASSANYLRENGWRQGETWGYEVRLPSGFDFARFRSQKLSLAEWQQLGILRVAGRTFPRPDDQAELFLPAGANGPAFLLLPNFAVIKRYNNSNSYALAVGHLADRILGGGQFVASWPEAQPLTRSQQVEMQTLLAQLGYYRGEIDGVVGPVTREAIANFQTRAGLPADGYPTNQVLQLLQRAL